MLVAMLMGAPASLFAGSAKSPHAVSDPQMTGLPELSAADIEWQNKHMLKVKKVKLNKLGLKRINAWRKSQGKSNIAMDGVEIAELGMEIEGTVGELLTDAIELDGDMSSLPLSDIPGTVDNSALKYFPPVRSQGALNSCGVFNGTYYAMTYMHALANDLDAKTGGDGNLLSPKWTYNMVNGGTNAGTWYYWAYEIGQKNGCASWQEFPYVGSTSNTSYYREWSTDGTVWRNAIDRKFDQYGYVGDTNQDAGIEQVKLMLLNGYILNFPTYIHSWQWKTTGNDPETALDDAVAGQSCAYWVNGTDGYHAMTVVGYNDHLWVDINGNSLVDAGEKGAFRIANSWGTSWGDGGFAWMAYDALKSISAVSGGPSTGRVMGWSPARAHWVTAKIAYSPSVVAEINIIHKERDHLRLSLGISDTAHTAPTTIWYSEMISYQGGPYAFDGTTTAVEGHFFLDFTDIVPSGGETKRYYLGISDRESGVVADLLSYKLIDVTNGNEILSADAPLLVDGEEQFVDVDYNFDDGNLVPVAEFVSDVTGGQAPIEVFFDGLASFDPDGNIVSYQWNFGDGASATGATVSHTYSESGAFTATLTVTDNLGASATASMVITVDAPPATTVFVDDIAMSLSTKGANKEATAIVTILDFDKGNIPVSGITVSCQWSGLASASATAVTASDGTALFTAKAKGDGTFTIDVLDVTGGNYNYDPTLNIESGDSISTTSNPDPPPDNQVPVALSDASPSIIGIDEWVSFDGSASYDPDGHIVTYDWVFGDGSEGSGITTDHQYTVAGSYDVLLTVTDDQGAMDSATLTIVVEEDAGPKPAMFVGDIAMDLVYSGVNGVAVATVSVVDVDGFSVPDAAVSGSWSGLATGSAVVVTNSLGKAVFESSKSKKSGSFAFRVTHIDAVGYAYDSTLNIETEDGIDQ